MKFSVRVRDLELRSCSDSLLDKEPHTTAEIVQWIGHKEEVCFTIARWAHFGRRHQLNFVGDRPLNEDIKLPDFWTLVQAGQSLLEKLNMMSTEVEEI